MKLKNVALGCDARTCRSSDETRHKRRKNGAARPPINRQECELSLPEFTRLLIGRNLSGLTSLAAARPLCCFPCLSSRILPRLPSTICA